MPYWIQDCTKAKASLRQFFHRLYAEQWGPNFYILEYLLNYSWISAKAETPIRWPPDVKNWLLWKDPDAGKDWRWEEKGTTEDEMVEWHHQLDGHEIEETLGVGDGQGSLVCCRLWGHKESDTTEWLNWTRYLQGVDILYLIYPSSFSSSTSPSLHVLTLRKTVKTVTSHS